MQLRNACESYLEDAAARCVPGSVALRKKMSDDLLEWAGERDLDAVTSGDIRKFIVFKRDRCQWSSSTVANRMILLKIMFNWFVNEGYMTESPCRTLKKPTFKPQHFPVLTEEEAKVFFSTPVRPYRHRVIYSKYMQSRDKTMFWLAGYAGLRADEIRGLDLEHIDLGHNRVLVHGKRNKVIWQPIPPILVEQLFEYLKLRMGLRSECQAVFYGRIGRRIAYPSMRLIFDRHLKTCGLPSGYGYHSLRHTYATTLMRKGVDMRRIQELLRHENISTTLSIYVHPDERDLRNAISTLSY